jgi:hypothetical protein
MINILVTETVRPNKVSDAKNQDYHLKFARYFLGSISRQKHREYLMHSFVNWSFYRGMQWIFDEDLDAFLMDETGEARNRIRFRENAIRPMVRMMKNNAIRVDYTYQAEAMNANAMNRREEELLRRIGMTKMANLTGGQLGESMRNNYPIGESEGETEQIFDDTYSDPMARSINYLLTFIANQNRVERQKVRLAEHLAVDGICINREYPFHGTQKWEIILPISYFWDRGAKDPSLQDGEFMGHIEMMIPQDIYSRKENMTAAEKESIELFIKSRSFENYSYLSKFGTTADGRVPVFRVEWRDNERQEWGWVKDEGGMEVFMRVNYKGGKYKTKDCVMPSDREARKELNDKNIMVRYPTVTRHISFIPKEYVPSTSSRDIVLEWGVIPYSELDYFSPQDNNFTYKVGTFQYYDGEVASPIDDAIDPQRMINRLRSAGESSINNARPPVPVFDKMMIDNQDGEEGLQRNINTGKAIFINAGGNVQNAVGATASTLGTGTQVYFDIADNIKNFMRDNAGINDAMQGTIGGRRELVGVTDSMIERGSLMQEDFYFALGDCLEQMYQGMASRGKSIFVENKTMLFYAVGDQAAKPLMLTQEYLNEYFRIFIKRTQPETDQKLQANTLALQFVQMRMLDERRFSQVYNRGNVDDVVRAMREYVAEMEMAKQQAAPGIVQAENAQAAAPVQQGYDQMVNQNANAQADRELKLQELMSQQQ